MRLLKIPFTNLRLFERSAAPAPTLTPVAPTAKPVMGSALRSITVHPGEAKLMRDVFEFQGEMLRDMRAMNTRAYDAAMSDNFNVAFQGTYGTANTEIFTYFYKVWARARKLETDSNYGKAIVTAYCNNVVGHDPFRLTMHLGETKMQEHPVSGKSVKIFKADNDANREIEDWWEDHCKAENFTIQKTLTAREAYMQIIAETVTVGGCIVRHWEDYVSGDGKPLNDCGYAINLLEIDRLDPSFTTNGNGTANPIRASVERDKKWDFPVAYHILTRHPGEFVAKNYPGPGLAVKNFRERVPAVNITKFDNLRRRAEQDMGFTQMEACIRQIFSNFQYADALTKASIASACKPWVIEKDIPNGIEFTPDSELLTAYLDRYGGIGPTAIAANGGTQVNSPSAITGQQGLIPPVAGISPAAMQVMQWGFKMKVLDPKFPIEAAEAFRDQNDRQIASAAGVSYTDLTGNFQSMGYIAAQMSTRPSRDNYMVYQEQMIDIVVTNIFRRALKAAIMCGRVKQSITRLDGICQAAHFKGKRWPFTDMLREITGLIDMQNAGMMDPQSIQDQMVDGRDVADVVAGIAEVEELRATYGLPPLLDAPTMVKVQEDEMDPSDSTPGQAAGKGKKPPPKKQVTDDRSRGGYVYRNGNKSIHFSD